VLFSFEFGFALYQTPQSVFIKKNNINQAILECIPSILIASFSPLKKVL
jgi:hypothetical protein